MTVENETKKRLMDNAKHKHSSSHKEQVKSLRHRFCPIIHYLLFHFGVIRAPVDDHRKVASANLGFMCTILGNILLSFWDTLEQSQVRNTTE